MVLNLISSLLLISSAQADTRTYDIKGMHCGGCVDSIKEKVCKIPGVESCEVSMGKIQLSGSNLDDKKIKKAVVAAGHYKVIGVEHGDAKAAQDIKPQPGPTLEVKDAPVAK